MGLKDFSVLLNYILIKSIYGGSDYLNFLDKFNQVKACVMPQKRMHQVNEGQGKTTEMIWKKCNKT